MADPEQTGGSAFEPVLNPIGGGPRGRATAYHVTAGIVLSAIALFGVAGCRKSDPFEIRVVTDTRSAFSTWRGRYDGDFSRAEWHEFDDALQELRLQIMADSEATGSVAIETVLRSKLDAHTVREVLVLADSAKLGRLRAERAALLVAIEQNSRLKARPGDTTSSDYLAQVHARQAEHLNQLDHDLADTGLKLKQLGLPRDSDSPKAPSPAP